ncbi:fluoride efflux transporter CrcB [Massilia niastensis]|uniref:fluoride efflux transporter CrcB n=1 Tax=Massilia niastensis TaxID=544911 RepID=UPI000476F696|nr:fluoride efflux transporter CrcB [Massilia niastensis]
MSWLAVGAGAAIGAWLRWGLAIWLSRLHAHVQAGTLAANLVGGYLVGLALAFFASHPNLSPEWRLFIITGFLGGLTTFSSFAGESVVLLQRGQVGWALAHTALHLFGSLLLCAAGFATWRVLRA